MTDSALLSWQILTSVKTGFHFSLKILNVVHINTQTCCKLCSTSLFHEGLWHSTNRTSSRSSQRSILGDKLNYISRETLRTDNIALTKRRLKHTCTAKPKSVHIISQSSTCIKTIGERHHTFPLLFTSSICSNRIVSSLFLHHKLCDVTPVCARIIQWHAKMSPLPTAIAHYNPTAEIYAGGSAWGRRLWNWCPPRSDPWPSSYSDPCRDRVPRPLPPRFPAWCPRWCRTCVQWRPPSAFACAPHPAGMRRIDRSAPRKHRTPDAHMSMAASSPFALKQNILVKIAKF